MRIDRRLTLLGIILVVLSTVMATQYATTRIAYEFGIVHPSDADIRFIGSDNSSKGLRVLRVEDNTSGSRFLSINLGDWSPNMMKNYTAAFGIVNEELFKVNITYVSFATGATGIENISIWLHGNRSMDAWMEEDSAKVLVVDKGVSVHQALADTVGGSTAWQLGAGDQNSSNMSQAPGTAIPTPWDGTAHVRYSLTDLHAINGTSDFVWVQISLDIPANAPQSQPTGTLLIHFEATTHD